jgi:hypothetical protein
MEAVRAQIEERLAPVVLVAGTPAAEAILAANNGLSIVDFLRPQARIAGMNGARSRGRRRAGGGACGGACGGQAACSRFASGRPVS